MFIPLNHSKCSFFFIFFTYIKYKIYFDIHLHRWFPDRIYAFFKYNFFKSIDSRNIK